MKFWDTVTDWWTENNARVAAGHDAERARIGAMKAAEDAKEDEFWAGVGEKVGNIKGWFDENLDVVGTAADMIGLGEQWDGASSVIDEYLAGGENFESAYNKGASESKSILENTDAYKLQTELNAFALSQAVENRRSTYAQTSALQSSTGRESLMLRSNTLSAKDQALSNMAHAGISSVGSSQMRQLEYQESQMNTDVARINEEAQINAIAIRAQAERDFAVVEMGNESTMRNLRIQHEEEGELGLGNIVALAM